MLLTPLCWLRSISSVVSLPSDSFILSRIPMRRDWKSQALLRWEVQTFAGVQVCLTSPICFRMRELQVASCLWVQTASACRQQLEHSGVPTLHSQSFAKILGNWKKLLFFFEFQKKNLIFELKLFKFYLFNFSINVFYFLFDLLLLIFLLVS